MARYTGPKCRLCRREGGKLFLKGQRCFSPLCPIEKKGAVPPGVHRGSGKRRLSSYGIQLREKQKLKRIYGVLEQQFKKDFKKAGKKKGNTGEILLQLLESRLDNIVYRLGFANARSFARQLVNHGFVLVNNKKVDIPSYHVKKSDIISLKPKALEMVQVKKSLEEIKKEVIPSWLVRKGPVGKVASLPTRDEIKIDVNEQLVVEYYSR